MGKVIVNEELRKELVSASTPGAMVELCDNDGNVLGYFTGKADTLLEPQVSEAELDRREQETKLYTHDEVMQHLRSL